MKELQELQREIGEWSQQQFGDNVSKWTGQKMFSQNALTGLVEEVGELNHVTICRHQGRRGYNERQKYEKDRNDAVADIMIFLCDYAQREGIDLLKVLNDTWNKVVSKRTVENWEQHSHENIGVSDGGETGGSSNEPSAGGGSGVYYTKSKPVFFSPLGLSNEALKLPKDWCEAYGIELYDPDGWRTPTPHGDMILPPKSVDVAIDEFQFLVRVQASTIKGVGTTKIQEGFKRLDEYTTALAAWTGFHGGQTGQGWSEPKE